ncbi:hypothetical protein Btru_077759 [Bulinus truncatus]|nr:hypothetical protein Btru_077759 [Bulinus truncatus]
MALSVIEDKDIYKVRFHFLFPFLSLRSISLESYITGGVNITGFEIFTEGKTVQYKRKHMKEVKIYDHIASDTVNLLAESLRTLQKSQGSISVFADVNGWPSTHERACLPQLRWKWKYGSTLAQTNMTGNSGFIAFQSTGQRKNYSVDVQEVTMYKGISILGTWYSHKGFQVHGEEQVLDKANRTIDNRTRIVTSIDEEPYLMSAIEVADGIPVIGRFRFIGYCSDLAEMVSRNVGYEYHIRFVKDGEYGRKQKDGTWNGVIGELIKHIGSVEDDLKVPIKGDCNIMLSADYMLHQTSLQDSGLMSIERSEPNDALERATSHTLEGWELKVVKRLSGQSLGKYDIYYYSPTREKFRSRIQLQKYIESKNLQLNLDIFTFSVKTLEALGYLKNPHKWPHKLNLPTKPNSHPVQIQRKPSQPNLRLRSLTRKKSDQNVEIQKETPQPQQRSVKKNESEESELQKRKTDTANDLKGWRIKLVKRLTGQNAGKYDIYYFSPSDEKFRSRPELQKYIESNNLDLDLNQFKFSVKSLMSMRQNEEAHRWPLEVSDLQ